MSWKKYIPGSTLVVQILLVVTVIGAIGGIAFGQNWIRTNIFGRM